MAIGDRLRKKRDSLWREFCRMPRRSSFSGLQMADRTEDQYGVWEQGVGRRIGQMERSR